MSFEDREEAMNQRMQMTSRNWERQGKASPLEEGTQPTLILAL